MNGLYVIIFDTFAHKPFWTVVGLLAATGLVDFVASGVSDGDLIAAVVLVECLASGVSDVLGFLRTVHNIVSGIVFDEIAPSNKKVPLRPKLFANQLRK